jgi:two-component system copper resistance phosphate regulon response regulator CusR
VLDTMLPGIDGLGLLAALRQSKQTPVIMLTARHRVEDRVRGLKAGADDYLVKPFAFSELVARIEVLLRRVAGTAPAPDALVLCSGGLAGGPGAAARYVRAGQRIWTCPQRSFSF